jgi:hypothetical protein
MLLGLEIIEPTLYLTLIGSVARPEAHRAERAMRKQYIIARFPVLVTNNFPGSQKRSPVAACRSCRKEMASRK